MKNLSLLIFLICNVINAQEREYFVIDKNKFLKPIKYILFNSKQDVKKDYKEDIYFYIKGEGFQFSKVKHVVDTCSVSYLKKIKLENVNKLNENEYLFYKKTIRNIKDWEKKRLRAMPLTELHPYFRIVIIEKYMKNKIIKYEVDWDYSGTRGLHVKEQ